MSFNQTDAAEIWKEMMPSNDSTASSELAELNPDDGSIQINDFNPEGQGQEAVRAEFNSHDSKLLIWKQLNENNSDNNLREQTDVEPTNLNKSKDESSWNDLEADDMSGLEQFVNAASQSSTDNTILKCGRKENLQDFLKTVQEVSVVMDKVDKANNSTEALALLNSPYLVVRIDKIVTYISDMDTVCLASAMKLNEPSSCPKIQQLNAMLSQQMIPLFDFIVNYSPIVNKSTKMMNRVILSGKTPNCPAKRDLSRKIAYINFAWQKADALARQMRSACVVKNKCGIENFDGSFKSFGNFISVGSYLCVGVIVLLIVLKFVQIMKNKSSN